MGRCMHVESLSVNFCLFVWHVKLLNLQLHVGEESSRASNGVRNLQVETANPTAPPGDCNQNGSALADCHVADDISDVKNCTKAWTSADRPPILTLVDIDLASDVPQVGTARVSNPAQFGDFPKHTPGKMDAISRSLKKPRGERGCGMTPVVVGTAVPVKCHIESGESEDCLEKEDNSNDCNNHGNTARSDGNVGNCDADAADPRAPNGRKTLTLHLLPEKGVLGFHDGNTISDILGESGNTGKAEIMQQYFLDLAKHEQEKFDSEADYLNVYNSDLPEDDDSTLQLDVDHGISDTDCGAPPGEHSQNDRLAYNVPNCKLTLPKPLTKSKTFFGTKRDKDKRLVAMVTLPNGHLKRPLVAKRGTTKSAGFSVMQRLRQGPAVAEGVKITF